MSLYELAQTSNRNTEPILIIKSSATAAMDDPQNVAVFSNADTGASIVLSPTTPYLADDPGQPGAVGGSPPVVINASSPQVKTALANIARFIPTETVTIYLGAISAGAAIQSSFPPLSQEVIYWVIGIFLTPLIFFLVWAVERSKLKMPLFSDFPYWKLTAAVIGFLVWGLAVPGNPYVTSDVAKVATAFAALLVSIFLDLIDQLFEARKFNMVTA